jgi:RsmE family RNA methyltransferase
LNLVLFERTETSVPLARIDRRAVHLLEVLRRGVGDTFDAGVINGPRGKGTVVAITNDTVSLTFSWGSEPPVNDALTLVIGLPRPQTARAVLRDIASLGVTALHFVATEKGDPNYGHSTLWHSGEWRRHLLAGVEQAFCTRLPDVTFGHSLATSIASLPSSGMTRIALDNYESPSHLSQLTQFELNVTLAIGSERGWSAAEREFLRTQGFALAHLGIRVLRTETACIAAVTLVKARLGWL